MKCRTWLRKPVVKFTVMNWVDSHSKAMSKVQLCNIRHFSSDFLMCTLAETQPTEVSRGSFVLVQFPWSILPSRLFFFLKKRQRQNMSISPPTPRHTMWFQRRGGRQFLLDKWCPWEKRTNPYNALLTQSFVLIEITGPVFAYQINIRCSFNWLSSTTCSEDAYIKSTSNCEWDLKYPNYLLFPSPY